MAEEELVEEESPGRDISAWCAVLDQLEAGLGAAALHADVAARGGDLTVADTWTPPADLGPLPAELAGRARAMLAGQRELISELEETRQRVAKRLSIVRSVPSARSGAASAVYLDVTG